MDFEHQGRQYATMRASDLERDGMGLELRTDGKTVAEVFFSDASGDFTVSIFSESLPMAVVELLITEAKVVLLPVV